MGLSKSFTKKVRKAYEEWEFEVGILDDKPHFEPLDVQITDDGKRVTPELKNYAGGPVRKTSRVKSELSTGQIFIKNQERLNRNLLLEPFADNNSAPIKKFMNGFLRMAILKNVSAKRVENLLQAVVRNPILRLEYGSNSATTADMKGFDRLMFDTGQMFKAIKARAKRVRK